MSRSNVEIRSANVCVGDKFLVALQLHGLSSCVCVVS